MNQHSIEGFNSDLDNNRFKIISKFIKGITVFEVGPGNGHMSNKLIEKFKVETALHLESYGTCLLKPFDTIICTNVLEHVEDTTKFLEKIKLYGDKETTFIFSIPNSHSHNRKMAFEIGLINDPSDLDKQDIAIGHKKMYDYFEFKNLIQNNGFHISKIFSQGYKPFPNSMMEKLSKELKEYCLKQVFGLEGCEIFIIGRLK